MIYLALTGMAIAFVETFMRAGVAVQVNSMLQVSREAVAVMSSRTLTDEQKEQRIRRSAGTLFVASIGVGMRLLIAVLTVGAIYVVATKLLAVPTQELYEGMLSPTGILVLTAAAVIYLKVRYAIRQRL